MWISPKDYAVLGEILAAARRQTGVTQDELAARLKKPQSFVSAYERGQRRVDILELFLILRTLELDPQDILGRIMKGLNTPV